MADDPKRRIRQLKQRLASVKQLAQAQQPMQRNVLSSYLKSLDAKSSKSGKSELLAESVGDGTLSILRVEVTKETVGDLAERADVMAIMPNQSVRMIKPKTLSREEVGKAERNRGMTWGLEALEAPKLWETGKGKGARVAVLDTGVFGNHPVLDKRLREFAIFDPLGNKIECKPSFDSGEHGTHVCGTIVGGKTSDGVSIGMTPEADLLVGGVLVGQGTLLALVKGIIWSIENGADVINMSLGFSYYEPLFTVLLKQVLDQYSVVPVVAIGNESHGNTSSPSSSPEALSVGALQMERRGRYRPSVFSSGASLSFPADAEFPLIVKPDVAAPGEEVYSCIPPQKFDGQTFEYSYMSGTSMASPHVAGVVAVLMAAKPSAPVREILRALKDTAAHPDGDAARPDNRWGHGLVKPIEALAQL